MNVRFALIREGTSDDGLVDHIRTLLLRQGVNSAIGASRPYKGTIQQRLQEVWSEQGRPDLIFVHRDADANDSAPRLTEIRSASEACGIHPGLVIPVVPVQELEAWLLTDDKAIRRIVGKPSGRKALAIPKLSAIEGTSSPKEILKVACIEAIETSGARRTRESKRFPERRATLLTQLDIDGPVNSLRSWNQFVDALAAGVESLRAQIVDEV